MGNIGGPTLLPCVQPGCTFDSDGICLEGFPAGKNCPHRMQPVAASTDELSEVTGESTSKTETWVSLPDGYELSLESTASITRAYEAKVVVIAGEADAGKTTLISCIFEQFSEGPYAAHTLAWSDTILAFERICYRSRISSEADSADTERTTGLSPGFFHLQLRSENKNLSNLLVTDISGEAYRRALNNQEDALNLRFITRADFFVLLVDGERLASKELRQDGFRRGLLLLGALLQAKVLLPECPVRILIAKYDLLTPTDVDENTAKFVEYVEAEYQRFGSEHFPDFKVLHIASRPKKGSTLAYGFGVEPLLSEWLKAEGPETIIDFGAENKPLASERESAKYLWRRLGQKVNVN